MISGIIVNSTIYHCLALSLTSGFDLTGYEVKNHEEMMKPLIAAKRCGSVVIGNQWTSPFPILHVQ